MVVTRHGAMLPPHALALPHRAVYHFFVYGALALPPCRPSHWVLYDLSLPVPCVDLDARCDALTQRRMSN